MVVQYHTEPILERLLTAEDPTALHELGGELIAHWGLDAFEVVVREGELRQVIARAGQALPPMAGDGEASSVEENDGIWDFALSSDDNPIGWMRVRLARLPEPDLIESLQRISRWLRASVKRWSERERVHVLEQQLTLLRDHATDTDRLKEEFLSNLSHELRTPLTAILGFSEILLEGGQLPEKSCECVGRIHDNGRRLLQLLNRLIQLAKLEADRLNLNLMYVSPTEIAQSVISRVRPAAEAKGLQFVAHVEEVEGLYLDPQLFSESLCCVLENAVKFTDQGHVRVRVWGDLTRVFFEVNDSGRGIDASHMPFIFDAFWQGDGSMSRAVGGNGIGLTLANRLLHRMGGDIQVESVPGQGVTLLLSLPRELPLPQPRETRKTPHKHTEQFGLPFDSLVHPGAN